jgi:hypothetical protein
MTFVNELDIGHNENAIQTYAKGREIGCNEVDHSTETWTSQWNSAVTGQRGYGTVIDWLNQYTDYDVCLKTCGMEFGYCGNTFGLNTRESCKILDSEQEMQCVSKIEYVVGVLKGDQGYFGYMSAQAATGCARLLRPMNPVSNMTPMRPMREKTNLRS